MVNSKYVAFKVNKQTPTPAAPPQTYSTVINCRKSGRKRARKGEKEVRSQRVRLARIDDEDAILERSRSTTSPDDSGRDNSRPRASTVSSDGTTATALTTTTRHLFGRSKPQLHRPTKFRRDRPLTKSVDLDCWFTILSFSDPAQLLEMRSKIASCYRFLRDNPKLWEHSRNYTYSGSLPDPPSDLTEFQYAHLRHGHGCMSCGTPSTRKTYWAFLRRWCKTCLQSKAIKEHDAVALFKDTNGADISFIARCLPSGISDSWGNFIGVGPANDHSLKTVFLLSDVQQLVAEFIKESQENRISWHAEMRTWVSNKVRIVEERRNFAKRMELWEDATRQSKSFSYHEKKQARKTYFAEKASQLTPPISASEMERCGSYRRAVAIPKEPSITSWLQLKPKLEKEAADLRELKDRGFTIPSILSTAGMNATIFSTSGSSTPSADLY